MKVLAINGSARVDGNTALMIKAVFEPLEQEGIETEMVQLAGQPLRGCLACMKCWENQDGKCVIKNDSLNEIVEKWLPPTPSFWALPPTLPILLQR